MQIAKAGARERLESARSSLLDLSHRIHAKPELGFEEEHASAWLCEALDQAGFRVEKGVAGLPTAFVARAGHGPLSIGICAEYDCLPGIGHACGHNLIAAMSVGAGIVTRGGDAPNIVPAHTAAKYIIRADNLKELEELRERVRRCFEAGAMATGSKLEIVGGDKPYADMHHDFDLAAMYQRNAEALGRRFADLGPMRDRVAASTDMGNVSHAMPAIHPAIGIDSLPAVNHQPEFTAHCVMAAADQAIFDGALAMAWTIVDLASDPSTRARLLHR
jgi:metal-dependent amidase/aminoacylase/carboxypeptidase family protein